MTFCEATKRTIQLHRAVWKAGPPYQCSGRLRSGCMPPLLDRPVDRITAVVCWCVRRNYRHCNPAGRAVAALAETRSKWTTPAEVVKACLANMPRSLSSDKTF